LVVGEARGSGLATASALLFGQVRVIDIIVLSKQKKEKAMEMIDVREDHEDCYADQCLAPTAGTIDNECVVANA
jgi:hypothetical protein